MASVVHFCPRNQWRRGLCWSPFPICLPLGGVSSKRHLCGFILQMPRGKRSVAVIPRNLRAEMLGGDGARFQGEIKWFQHSAQRCWGVGANRPLSLSLSSCFLLLSLQYASTLLSTVEVWEVSQGRAWFDLVLKLMSFLSVLQLQDCMLGGLGVHPRGRFQWKNRQLYIGCEEIGYSSSTMNFLSVDWSGSPDFQTTSIKLFLISLTPTCK